MKELNQIFYLFYYIVVLTCLLFSTLTANSIGDKLIIVFFFFSPKRGFDISSKLSPLETICVKCQILYSGKIRHFMHCYSGGNLHGMSNPVLWKKKKKRKKENYFNMSPAEILPRVLNVNIQNIPHFLYYMVNLHILQVYVKCAAMSLHNT